EEVAFQARQEKKIDKRSGVSQRLPITCLENAVSNAERRAILAGERLVVPRVTDIYAALPSITGKFELEYEGELRGADNVARELIRSAVANVFAGRLDADDPRQIIDWFEIGGTLQLSDTSSAADVVARAREVQGLAELATRLINVAKPGPPVLASAIDFVLEGLYAMKKISRSDDRGYHSAEPPRRAARAEAALVMDDSVPIQGPAKKKYYN
ncbi:MAG: magnesium chelatase, partial [Acidobacteria bacterium]|nr:magnesium chelatase [Acidobacteriota bacterium]